MTNSGLGCGFVVQIELGGWGLGMQALGVRDYWMIVEMVPLLVVGAFVSV